MTTALMRMATVSADIAPPCRIGSARHSNSSIKQLKQTYESRARNRPAASGAGTNLKVRGHISSAGKKFLSCPSTFVALQVHVQLVVFGERFREGQYSLVSLLFAVLLAVLPVPSHL